MADSEDQIADMSDSSLSGVEEKQCKFCSSGNSKYLCPRCGVRYCSVPCYKSPSHLMCSEDFFKQCIQEELDSTPADPQTRKQMMEALQKMHETALEDGQEDELLDSDDEDADLATRLENIDLNNAEAVWSLLTDAERAEFESLVSSGDVAKILPVWTPWWCTKPAPLIEEVNQPESSATQNTPEYPALVPNIPVFYLICTVKPSPCIEFNMVNTIAAYTFTSRHYNGEPEHSAKESGSCLMQLSDNLNHNANFSEADLAVQAVVLNAVNIMKSSAEDTSLIKSDTKDITISKQFVLYALSGAFNILTQAKTELKCHKKHSATSGGDKSAKKSFSTRFPESSAASASVDFVLTKTSLTAALKKLEFYMSWVNAYYTGEPSL
ncbi:zinc finger HIT domain-containing protein 2-like isoform X2 [Diaphorina citri]|uniref:Zinc finger HIT domain-containing protein 2-like isoform X2 n=1 Tax=Diaphorina citri TaxID=121845 RepID=A0A1S4EBG0_DIACI|nr:zinc finger HIT domain-containing protein 2-like isoform X2 [Diaphorina citri]